MSFVNLSTFLGIFGMTMWNCLGVGAGPETTLAYWEKTGKLTGRKVILRLAAVLRVPVSKLPRP